MCSKSLRSSFDSDWSGELFASEDDPPLSWSRFAISSAARSSLVGVWSVSSFRSSARSFWAFSSLCPSDSIALLLLGRLRLGGRRQHLPDVIEVGLGRFRDHLAHRGGPRLVGLMLTLERRDDARVQGTLGTLGSLGTLRLVLGLRGLGL